jgi:cathepsin C
MLRTAALLGVVLADLPVHCLRSDVAGDWVFRLGALSATRTSCGHERPDVESKEPRDLLEGSPVHKQVTLTTSNTVRGDGEGTWTMIYDEGFEVRVDGMVFFAFSYFDLDGTQNTTHCDRTLRGWYREGDRYGCYQGERVGGVVRKEAAPRRVSLLEVSSEAHRPLSMQFFQRTAATINARGGRTWRAKAYSRFAGKSLSDLNRFAGLPRPLPRLELIETDQDEVACSPEIQHAKPGSLLPHLMLRGLPKKPCNHPAKHDEAMDKELAEVQARLPKEFSWTDVNGTDYVGPVIDQSDCGSCYIVSTTRMMSSRHRIAQRDASLPDFSAAFPLQCSEYNQGCKGGYAFLASKWAEDVGLLPEQCAPYKTDGTCEVQCDVAKQQKWRATEYNYIGGYYGATNAAKMMQELHDHGPVVVSFEPSDEFMYYADGVFVSGETKQHQEWQKVDHAVLLVGWGEEAGQPYWLVQNSWGNTWGQMGFFKIARGTNDSGIESISVAAQVVADKREGNAVADFLAQNA